MTTADRIGVALAAVLLGATAMALVAPSPPVRVAPPRSMADTVAAVPLPPLAQFGDVIEHNLFAAGRGKSAIAASSQAVANGTPGLDLIGIVISGGKRAALFRTSLGHVQTVVEGGRIAGWTVIAVEPTRARLKSDQSSTIVEMYRPQAGKSVYPLQP
jgi:hypothetical protein